MNRILRLVRLRTALLGVLALLAACEQQRPVYALTSAGRILTFDTAKPGQIDAEVAVRGLPEGESLVQIDYRPANAAVYGVTSKARVCAVNVKTGAVTLVGSAAFTSETLAGPVIDFNPVVDRLRVIASEQNLRVNPNDGALVATDEDPFFDGDDANDGRTPQLAAIAYDRNRSNSAATTLFGLDVTTQSLVRVGSRNGAPDSPNTGRLFTIAKLPVTFSASAGFDIEPDGDTAYAALAPSGAGAVLYRIGLSDGSADRVEPIGKGDRTIISLTVGPEQKAGGSP